MNKKLILVGVLAILCTNMYSSDNHAGLDRGLAVDFQTNNGGEAVFRIPAAAGIEGGVFGQFAARGLVVRLIAANRVEFLTNCYGCGAILNRVCYGGIICPLESDIDHRCGIRVPMATLD